MIAAIAVIAVLAELIPGARSSIWTTNIGTMPTVYLIPAIVPNMPLLRPTASSPAAVRSISSTILIDNLTVYAILCMDASSH